MNILKKNLVVLLLSAPLLLVSAYAQLTPTADSYTSAGSSTNYGTNALLDVIGGSQTTYIQFNLSSIPSGYVGSNVSKATLKLYVNAVNTAGNFNIVYVTTARSESAITVKTSPSLGGTIASAVPVTTSSLNQYILIDITSAVQAWLNGTQANNGIGLVGNGSLSASFDSKENTSMSHPPELDIVFVNSGPQGPVGPQGPAGQQGLQGPQGPIDLTGATGAQGPQGQTGPQGPQGATGMQGPAGAAGVGFNFRNTFSTTATYAVNDVVTYNGSTYTAGVANGPNTQTPDQNTSAWSVMALQGATGPQGPIGLTGAMGPQGPVGLTGATGSQGVQGLTGPQGPQGMQGATGAQGPAGTNGVSFNFRNSFDTAAAYAVNDVVTYSGSTYIAITPNGPGT